MPTLPDRSFASFCRPYTCGQTRGVEVTSDIAPRRQHEGTPAAVTRRVSPAWVYVSMVCRYGIRE